MTAVPTQTPGPALPQPTPNIQVAGALASPTSSPVPVAVATSTPTPGVQPSDVDIDSLVLGGEDDRPDEPGLVLAAGAQQEQPDPLGMPMRLPNTGDGSTAPGSDAVPWWAILVGGTMLLVGTLARVGMRKRVARILKD